jgi:hypothetical protein
MPSPIDTTSRPELSTLLSAAAMSLIDCEALMIELAMPVLLPVTRSNSPTSAVSAFCATCEAWATVATLLATSPDSTRACDSSAPSTACEVSLPSCPIVRSCPMVMPSPSAMARASRGVCSITLFSSSPRSVPDAKP